MSEVSKASNKSPSSALTSPRLLLARLTRLTSTIPGLDASLMLAQYSAPLIIALLLRIARFRANQAGKSGGVGLVRLADGWGKAAGSIADARVVMRAFGLLPILQYLLALHPNPLSSLKSLVTLQSRVSAKTLPTLQLVSLLCYYPLEHLAWLGTKGVIPLSPLSIGISSLLSVRFWALYVLLELYKLRLTYSGLNSRTKALRRVKISNKSTEVEGFELQSVGAAQSSINEMSLVEKQEKAGALRNDWEEWKSAIITNAGYAPLTIHWSTIGGLWQSALLTGGFGTLAATGRLIKEWRATAA